MSDAIAKRNVAVLVAAQGVLGAQMPMIFTFGGLAGQSLTPNQCIATLPLTMIVVGSMLSATPLSWVMARFGRRAGFVAGSAGGFLGAVICAYALLQQSFVLFTLGSLFSGIYMSAQGFYRFAATDAASPAFQPKAISWVLAGGLLSAVIGPQIGNLTTDYYIVPFLGLYLAVAVLNLVGSLVFLFLVLPPVSRLRLATATAIRSRAQMLRDPRIAVAITCATVSYALMNLVMTSTPLAVVGCGFAKEDAGTIVSSHVLAMYLPSFYTGHLIARFGSERIIAFGLMILAGAGAVAMSGVELSNFYITLVLLGIGWNFGFIGATAMLTSAQRPDEGSRLQGLNDLIVFGGVSVASLASGGLMNCSGGSVQAGWQLVNIAMLPFLVAAGGALIWLWLRPAEMRPR
jgi:MFS family permease